MSDKFSASYEEELEKEISKLRTTLLAVAKDSHEMAVICRSLKEERNIFRDAIKSILEIHDGDWSGIIFTLRFAGDKESASKIESCIAQLKTLMETSNE